MPAWALVYAVVLLLGLIAGLLLRFFVALVFLVAGTVGLVWLLGYVSTAQLAGGLARLAGFLAGPGAPGTSLFTVAGLVFLVGVCGGVLLTSRLRAFDRIAVP